MPDFTAYEANAKDLAKTRKVRYDRHLAELLEEASCALGVDEDDFVRSAIYKEAMEVVGQQPKRWVLSPRDGRSSLTPSCQKSQSNPASA